MLWILLWDDKSLNGEHASPHSAISFAYPLPYDLNSSRSLCLPTFLNHLSTLQILKTRNQADSTSLYCPNTYQDLPSLQRGNENDDEIKEPGQIDAKSDSLQKAVFENLSPFNKEQTTKTSPLASWIESKA